MGGETQRPWERTQRPHTRDVTPRRTTPAATTFDVRSHCASPRPRLFHLFTLLYLLSSSSLSSSCSTRRFPSFLPFLDATRRVVVVVFVVVVFVVVVPFDLTLRDALFLFSTRLDVSSSSSSSSALSSTLKTHHTVVLPSVGPSPNGGIASASYLFTVYVLSSSSPSSPSSSHVKTRRTLV